MRRIHLYAACETNLLDIVMRLSFVPYTCPEHLYEASPPAACRTTAVRTCKFAPCVQRFTAKRGGGESSSRRVGALCGSCKKEKRRRTTGAMSLLSGRSLLARALAPRMNTGSTAVSPMLRHGKGSPRLPRSPAPLKWAPPPTIASSCTGGSCRTRAPLLWGQKIVHVQFF